MKIGLVEVPYYFGREGVSMSAGPARYKASIKTFN